MAKNNGGFLTFVTGAVMGAAAVFLSKKENRKLVRSKYQQTKKSAEKLAEEIKKDPEKATKAALAKGKKIVQSATTKLSKKKS